MKYVKFIVVLLVSVLFINGFAQTTPAKSGNTQQKVVRINSQKPAEDPNKKTLNIFSKDQMFSPSTPTGKPLSPTEVGAKEYYDEGNKKGKSGDYEGAIAAFTKSINITKFPVTYVQRAIAYYMVRNYSAAVEDASEALNLVPLMPRALIVRGLSLYDKGEYKEAKADLTMYLERERSNAGAFNIMAAICYINKDFNDALVNYKEVVRLNPKYPDVYNNCGMMRTILQDYKGALLDYNQALLLTPSDPTIYNNRGGAYAQLKDYKAAMADFDKAISLDNKYADAYNSRGRVKQVMGDMDGACADWQKAYVNGLEATKELIIKFCK